jgi:four helix bundle protein
MYGLKIMNKLVQSPHKKLEAWKKSMDLVELIYAATSEFPVDEKFGLVSQMRRAAVSVPSNIAEGAGRRTDAEFINFLTIAIGSLSELDTQLELSGRLGYLDNEQVDQLVQLTDHCKALVFGLRKSISTPNHG